MTYSTRSPSPQPRCQDCFHLVKGRNRRHPCLRQPGEVRRQCRDPACRYFMAIAEGNRRFAPPQLAKPPAFAEDCDE